MEIILKEDVSGLGNANDIIKVKTGYGRNYLIPKKLAILATPSAKKVHAENMRQRSHKEDRLKNEALEKMELLQRKTIKIGAKTSTSGKIFGSVNTIQIAEALSKKGVEVDRKMITILNEDSIKEVGTYKAKVKFFKNIEAEIEFEVFSE